MKQPSKLPKPVEIKNVKKMPPTKGKAAEKEMAQMEREAALPPRKIIRRLPPG